MTTNANPTKVVLRNVRLAFPRLDTPQQVNGEGAPAFSAAFILESDSAEFEANKAAIEAAMKHVAKEKWGEKAAAVYKSVEASGKLALHDGDTKAEIDGYAGNLYINARASASSPPSLVRRDRSLISREKIDGTSAAEIELYGGCYVNVILNMWAQDNKYGKRVNASLAGVQYVREGVPFAGTAPAAADEFDQLDVPGDFDEGLL